MRCILYLADGDLQKLEEALKLHGFDERDLILQAEYEWLGPIAGGFASEHGKQVRDFSLPFEEGCQ